MRSENEPSGQSFIADARREQIKQAAMETIAEIGFGRASLAQIAKRAGISKGVISYHFAGKDELMEKLVIEFYTAGAFYMVPKIQAETTSVGKLRAYLESNVDYIAQNRIGIIAVGDVLVNLRDGEGRLKFLADSEGHKEMIGHVAELFREGQESGEFRDFDTWVMAEVLRSSVDVAANALRDDPDVDLAHYCRELVDYFLHATRKDPS